MFILIVLAVSVAGYWQINDKVSSFEDNTQFAKTAEAIRKSTVIVLAQVNSDNSPLGVSSTYVDAQGNVYSKGTGFAIGNGWIITAKHVIENAESATIVTEDGTTYPVIHHAEPENQDVALLWSDANLPPVSFDERNYVPVGSKIAFIGFPLNSKEKQGLAITHDGVVSSLTQLGLLNGIADKPVFAYTINSFVNKGNSGGPLFLADSGKVIGLINARENANPLLELPNFDPDQLSAETKLVVTIQMAMYQKLVENSQMGIGHATGINNHFLDEMIRQIDNINNIGVPASG